MANHKQAIKRHRQNTKRRTRNRAALSHLRTLVKRARASIASGKPDPEVIKAATTAFDRAVTKGVLHKRTASRRVSRMTRAANKSSQ